MKKTFLLLAFFCLISCTQKSSTCNYSKLKMTNQIGDSELKTAEFDGCFSITKPDELGMMVITEKDSLIKVIFDTAGDFLNVKGQDNKLVEYRRRFGHQIMIENKVDSLIIIYGDIKGSKSKSSLLFIK